MRTDKIKHEIEKLEMSEKLLLIEDVWDEIAKSNQELPLTEWQKKELDKRLTLYDKGQIETNNWHEVHESLREKDK